MANQPGALKAVRDYFGFKLADMKTEWTPLPQKDKDEILSGLMPNEAGAVTETY